MKKTSIIFLQAVIALIGVSALAFLLWEPHIEGRNAHATLYQIYFNDPFLVYAYIASVPFFMALFHALQVLKYIGMNKVFSPATVKSLRTIKQCALSVSVFVAGGEAYIFMIQHGKGDDIAGGVVMGLVFIFLSVVVAAATSLLEGILQDASNMKRH